jgi:hypothetical protein
VAEPSATASPFEWRVHSANEGAGGGLSGNWLWLTLLGAVLGAGLMFLGQRVWRQRGANADEAMDWEQPAEETGAHPASVLQPVERQPALDLTAVLAEPVPEAQPPAPAIEPAPAQPIPAPNLASGPLEMALTARRLSATLMNTVLHYELTVSNNGKDPIGPVMVGGDMIAAHASLPDRAQLELGSKDIAALHKFASLAPGESTTVTGEFKLPLAAITPIRSGNAALFIPLARFRIEAGRAGTPPLVLARTFVVGEDQELPGSSLKPFRLDLGPRLYSRIGQRELALTA